MSFNLNLGDSNGNHIEVVSNFTTSAIETTPIQEFNTKYNEVVTLRGTQVSPPTFEEIYSLLTEKSKLIISTYPISLITKLADGTIYGLNRGVAPLTDRYFYYKVYSPTILSLTVLGKVIPPGWPYTSGGSGGGASGISFYQGLLGLMSLRPAAVGGS